VGDGQDYRDHCLGPQPVDAQRLQESFGGVQKGPIEHQRHEEGQGSEGSQIQDRLERPVQGGVEDREHSSHQWDRVLGLNRYLVVLPRHSGEDEAEDHKPYPELDEYPVHASRMADGWQGHKQLRQMSQDDYNHLGNCRLLVTIVSMGTQDTDASYRNPAIWVAGTGLLGAILVMLLPGTLGQSSEIAAVLAVGALAMLAGHKWALLIVALADAMLVGRVWPVIAFPEHQSSVAVAIAMFALLAAVPGLVQLGRTMPRTVDVIIGTRSPRVHSAGVLCSSLLLAAWVVAPAF
jgi:hypothetical protein